MGKIFIGVREVDEDVLRKFRVLAVAKNLKLGDALSKALKHWIKQEKEKKPRLDPKNLRKITGIIKTKEKVKWSEEIDEILYGGNDIS